MAKTRAALGANLFTMLRHCFIIFIIATAVGLSYQSNAQTVDPLVEEGVQLRIEYQELRYLKRTAQIDNAMYQERYKTFQLSDRQYRQKTAKLTRDEQRGLTKDIDNRYAIVFPPIQDKWNAVETKLQAESKALSAERAKELETDVPLAAQIQADRILRQRQVEQKTITQQDADTKDAADTAKISALQDKYTGYGGSWASSFNRKLQGRTEQLLQTASVTKITATPSSKTVSDAQPKTPNISVTAAPPAETIKPAVENQRMATKPVREQIPNPAYVPRSKRMLNDVLHALGEGLVFKSLVFAGLLLLRIYFGYRKLSPETKKIQKYSGFCLAYTKKRWGRILLAALIWMFVGAFFCEKTADVFNQVTRVYLKPLIDSVFSFVIGLACIGSIVGFVVLMREMDPETQKKRAKKKKQKERLEEFEAFKNELVVERKSWLDGLGATHSERVNSINGIFDKKNTTLTFSIARRFTEFEKLGEKEFIYFRISRNLAVMGTREREMLRVVELLHSFSVGRDEEWYEWAKFGLLWEEGKAQIEYLGWMIELARERGLTIDDDKNAVNFCMQRMNCPTEQVVNNVLQRLENSASKKDQNPELAKLLSGINRRLKGGSEWLSAEDISATPFAPQNKYALKIGSLDDGDGELTYSGEGSLISIAPPGSGKTQCNVFPNLLTWNGPAVVLDVKGEIYAKTSKWRSENIGPVYKFSPLEPAKSHCYNPLSFVRQETDFIWEDSRFVADMMIVPTGGTDVFWENKARDVLTAAIAYVCYSNPPDQRPMSRITDIIHGGKPWQEMILGLQTAVDVRSMMQQGNSLSEMNEKTRDSVLQTAQSSLSAWTGERISRVTQKSDWSPLDLRSGGNPTIYICLKPSEVDSYISLLRVFIAQHIRMLTNELPPHGSAPILFLLDELPRLKQMPPVEEAIEIGRQYGIRLWMFAQSLGQLEQAYPNAEGLIGSCAVRIFMNPSSHDGTAEKLSDELGFRESALDGARLKVVEAVDLAGPDYKDYQIVMASGCKPVKVKKAFAWQDAELSKRMGSL